MGGDGVRKGMNGNDVICFTLKMFKKKTEGVGGLENSHRLSLCLHIET